MELEHFERIISRIHNYIQIVRFLKLQKIKWQVITEVNVANLSTEVSFINTITKHLVHFCNLGMSLKILLQQKTDSYFWGHSEDFLLPEYCGIGHSPLLLQWPKLHLSMFCSKSEMVCPWFIACQEPDFCCDGIFKLMPRSDKCVSVLRDYVEE
jgi:hypothetical protein